MEPQEMTKAKITIVNGQMFAARHSIVKDPGFNARTEMGDMESLQADIRENGILDPLEVTPDPDSEFLILRDGHRRITAWDMLDPTNASDDKLIPIKFEKQGATEIDRLASMFSHSTGKALEPMEECNLFRRMLDLKYRPKDIARKIGRSLDYVKGRLELSKADPEVRKALEERKISAGTARKLAKKSKPEQAKAAQAARNTAGGKRAKSKAAKDAANIKTMKTEKEIRARLKTISTGKDSKSQRAVGFCSALSWVLGE